MRASAGSLMHNFKKRFRSSASPCASGVSVALRTRRLMYATDSGVYDDSRRAICIARSRALPLTVSCTSPFLSASRGVSGSPMRMCMSAAGVPMVRGSLCDTKIAGEREFESTGQGCARNGGDHRFWDALAQRDRLVQGPRIVGGVLGPLATGGAQGLCEADERSDGIMTNKITGCAASHDHNANLGVARESVQRRGERVPHLLVEVNALGAAQCNDRNPIGYSCRQNIGVHQVLLSWDGSFLLSVAAEVYL